MGRRPGCRQTSSTTQDRLSQYRIICPVVPRLRSPDSLYSDLLFEFMLCMIEATEEIIYINLKGCVFMGSKEANMERKALIRSSCKAKLRVAPNMECPPAPPFVQKAETLLLRPADLP